MTSTTLPTLRRYERPESGDPRLAGTLRGQTSINPEVQELMPTPNPKLKKAANQPLALFLSVRRSIPNPTEKVPPKKGAAYHDAFKVERGLEIRTLAQWWKARESLAAEDPTSKSAMQLAAAKAVLKEMLPTMTDWRVEGEQVLVDKIIEVNGMSSSGTTEVRNERRALPISALSDGEKSLISITTDIAQRLVALNPKDSDPIKTGCGVVLLDEIDLHLHPSWQRNIVEILTTAFPMVQFICTTHAPFVIQSLRDGNLIKLDGELDAPFENQSIEDISEDILDVEIPQRSHRHVELMHVASEYYRSLRQAENNPNIDVGDLKKELDALSLRYSDDPLVAGPLDFKWETFFQKRKMYEAD